MLGLFGNFDVFFPVIRTLFGLVMFVLTPVHGVKTQHDKYIISGTFFLEVEMNSPIFSKSKGVVPQELISKKLHLQRPQF